MPELSERDLKAISLLSPEPTVNYITSGKVSRKFVYLLCRNENCITRTTNEDVPPEFYQQNGVIRCRYCRRPYVLQNRKVSEEEQRDYISGLPTRIEPVVHD